MSKLTWLIAGGVGYLLGSRAGRGPYEKFSAQADRIMQNPRVQEGTEQAKSAVKRKADEVADSVLGDDEPTPATPRPTGGLP